MSEPYSKHRLQDWRHLSLLFIVSICSLPITANFLGVDFSSQSTPLNNTGVIKTELLFSAVAGAIHHALLEWSAFTLSILTALCSYIHYWKKRDIIVPIMGTALLAAGCVDAFHTLVATRIIQANPSNTDFIPFTWALSRVFHAVIIAFGALVSIWVMRQPKQSRVRKNEFLALSLISFLFIVLTYTVVHIAATSSILPKTMYPNALITRPFDVLPLALFCLVGAFHWAWYKQEKSIFKFALLLSIIPAVATQLHMAFGSSALFDNHFNIAHSIKILAYGSVFLGIIIDLAKTKTTEVNNHTPISTYQYNTDENKTMEVGTASRPLNIQLPLAGFLLSLSIAFIVGTVFYFETERLTIEQSVDNFHTKNHFIKPLLNTLYEDAFSDIIFLSRTQAVNKIAQAKLSQDNQTLSTWNKELGEVFTETLNTNTMYNQLRLIGIDDYGKEIVATVRQYSGITTLPKGRLSSREKEVFFSSTLTKDKGEVHFSKIRLARKNGEIIRPLTPILRVSTPVYNNESNEIFGIIVVDINFGKFINTIVPNITKDGIVYLANKEGDYLIHPDNSKTYSFEYKKNYRIQQEFPALATVFEKNSRELNIHSMLDANSNKEYLGIYTAFYFSTFADIRPLRLLVRYKMQSQLVFIHELRDRSMILALSLAFVALALSIIATRRVIHPLSMMSNSLAAYEKTGHIGELPIDSTDEIGVLARSFHNMMANVQYNSQQLKLSAIDAEENRASIQAIVNSAAEGIVSIDTDGSILSFNRAARAIFGYEEEEIIGQPVGQLMPSTYRNVHEKYINNYLKSGRSQIMGMSRELEGQRKNGELFPIALSVSEVRVGNKRIFTGLIRDISEQRKLEIEKQEALEAAEESALRLEFALTAPGIGVWDYNLINGELIWDTRMHSLYEIVKEEFLGSADAWKNALHPEDKEDALALLQHCVDTGSYFNTSFRIICPSGKIKYVVAHGKVLADNSGNYVRMVGINYDATEQKKLESERLEAMQKAQESAQLKSEFLASMSHEIRTPMNAVLGMLSLLLKGKLSEKQKHYASLAKSSANSLLTLINDILDFSKIEAGKLDLDIIDFDLVSQLSDFSEAMAVRAQDKGLELILDVSEINQAWVKGDPGRIRQVLTNLVGNAIKFTSHGEILISAELYQEGDDLSLRCNVKDTGIGIPKEKMLTLFDAFTQVDASTTRIYGGTGLGLAIAEQLCEIMGGGISVQSETDVGSCFEFTLLLQHSTTTKADLPFIDLSHQHILIIDDNATNLNILSKQLTRWGSQVTQANDGPTALQIMERSEFNFSFVIIDLQMPTMDGIELGSIIRSSKHFQNTQLIAMTSLTEEENDLFFTNIGFSTSCPKPCTPSKLCQTLTTATAHDKPTNTSAPTLTDQSINKEVPKEAHSKKILLVEDNRVNQEVALGILSYLGYSAQVASNGLEAIDALQNTPQQDMFEVILMDCQMPELDGYETSRRIRSGAANVPNKNIPIIAMTANAMRGDKEKCLDAGMSDYLTKPINEAALSSKLKQWLNTPSDNNPTAAITNDIAQKTNAPAKPFDYAGANLIVWDKEASLSRLHGRVDRLMMLIEMFPDQSAQYLTKMEQALINNNSTEVNAMAHALKSVAGTLGGVKLHTLSEHMEALAANNDFNTMEKLLPEIKQQYQHFSQLLAQELSHLRKPGASHALESEYLTHILQKITEQIKNGEHIDQDEINKISVLIKQADTENIMEQLRECISRFDIKASLKSIEQLALSQGISLKI